MKQKNENLKVEEFGLIDLIGFVARSWFPVLVFMIFTAIFTYIQNKENPTYSADALVLLESGKSNRVQALTEKIAGMQGGGLTDDSDRQIEKYMNYFGSKSFGQEVGKQIRNSKNFEKFLTSINEKNTDLTMEELGEKVQSTLVISKFNSETFRLSVTLSNPKAASEVANILLDAFVGAIIEKESRDLYEGKIFLNSQITEIEARLAEYDEQARQHFKQMQREKRSINKGKPPEDVGVGLEKAKFSIEGELDETNALIAEAEEQAQKEQTDGLTSNDKYNAATSLVVLKRKAKILTIRADALKKIIEKNKREPDDMLGNDSSLQDIYKKKELEYHLYSDLKKEVMNLDIQQISVKNKVRIMDRPGPSGVRSNVSLRPMIAKRSVFAAVVALLLVFFKDLYQPMVRGRKDMGDYGLLYFGSVPNLERRGKSGLFARLKFLFGASRNRRRSRTTIMRALETEHNTYMDMVFKNISARILSFRTEAKEPPKVISIMSGTSGEGKSTLSANVARAFSVSGKRVLLVDGDMRRRSISRVFGFDDDSGLSEFLKNPNQEYMRPLVKKLRKNFDFLPAGINSTETMELVSGKTFAEFVDAMKHFYDVIILDSPPAIPCSEVIPMAAASDLVILAVRVQMTKKTALEESLEKLQFGVSTPIGYVLNVHEEGTVSYYHDYSAANLNRQNVA